MGVPVTLNFRRSNVLHITYLFNIVQRRWLQAVYCESRSTNQTWVIDRVGQQTNLASNSNAQCKIDCDNHAASQINRSIAPPPDTLHSNPPLIRRSSAVEHDAHTRIYILYSRSCTDVYRWRLGHPIAGLIRYNKQSTTYDQPAWSNSRL